jgi:hypothetical protein
MMTEQFPAIVPKVDLAKIDALDETATQAVAVRTAEMSPFRRTFLVAAAARRLRELITVDMMADIMALQGSPLGFLTDRDKPKKDGEKPGYPVEIVKEVLIEAVVRGFRPVGNEFNIIAGRFYAAQSGLHRLVREWPGLTDLAISLAVPRQREGHCVVECRARWRLHGKECALDCTGEDAIPVRVNEGQLVDAIHGKARRKLYARILDRLAGMELGIVCDETSQDPTPAVEDQSQEPPPDPPDAAVRELARQSRLEEYRGLYANSDNLESLENARRLAGEDVLLGDEERRKILTSFERKIKRLTGDAQKHQRTMVDQPPPEATREGV